MTTQPTDQEHDMTSPIQRRHEEILGRLDALIDAVKPGDKQPAPEPVDVTEPNRTEPADPDPNVSVHLLEILRYAGDEWGPLGVALAAAGLTDKDALIHHLGNPVDTAPPVDPDDTEAYLTGKRTPDQTEQLAARVLDLEADVERLTRERDDLRARVDDLIRERGQAIERYKALREDVTAHALHHAHDQSSLAFDCFATTLEDDDKRGRDA